jgi:hypothetical protein
MPYVHVYRQHLLCNCRRGTCRAADQHCLGSHTVIVTRPTDQKQDLKNVTRCRLLLPLCVQRIQQSSKRAILGSCNANQQPAEVVAVSEQLISCVGYVVDCLLAGCPFKCACHAWCILVARQVWRRAGRLGDSKQALNLCLCCIGSILLRSQTCRS